jgi:hypothetical protein
MSRPVYVYGPKHLRYSAGCADSWEVSRSKRRGYMGERVIVMRWVESGEVELRHCKGDGRNIVGGFTTYLHTTVSDVDTALITARQIMEGDSND